MNAANEAEDQSLKRAAESGDTTGLAARLVLVVRERFATEAEAVWVAHEMWRMAIEKGDRQAIVACSIACARMKLHPRTP